MKEEQLNKLASQQKLWDFLWEHLLFPFQLWKQHKLSVENTKNDKKLKSPIIQNFLVIHENNWHIKLKEKLKTENTVWIQLKKKIRICTKHSSF